MGFSWDVFGDSSLKVYGNAGRYYLALPQATGERAASGSDYYRHSTSPTRGIDSNGVPTGLAPVPGVDGVGGLRVRCRPTTSSACRQIRTR